MRKVLWLGTLKILFIFTNCGENLPNIITTLKTLPFHQTRSKIMVILNESPKLQELRSMFEYFWAEKYLYVIAMFIEKALLKVFTFKPYCKDDNFLQDMSNTSVLDIYYNKLKDINGFTLKVMLLKDDDSTKIQINAFPNGSKFYTGREIKLLQTVSSKMNGTITYIKSDNLLKFGERNPWRQTNVISNNEAAIKIRLIRESGVDMMNSDEMMIDEELKGVTESLYPHAMDDMRILMAKRGKIPQYSYLFMVFTGKVWIMFAVVLIAGTDCWTLTGSTSYPTWINKLINILRILTGGSFPFRSRSSSEKAFITSLLFYSLIMITAFTSKFTSELMDTKYYSDFDTIDEVNEAGLIIHAWKTHIMELRKAYNGSKYRLFENMQPVPSEYDHVTNGTKRNANWTHFLLTVCVKYPFLLNTERANWIVSTKTLKNMFHVVRESPIPKFLAFQVPAGSPLLDELNANVRKIIEAGFFQFWKNWQRHEAILSKELVSDDKEDRVLFALSINHLSAAYIILISGLILSGVVFLFECLYHKLNWT